jgi:hypothetical protein
MEIAALIAFGILWVSFGVWLLVRGMKEKAAEKAAAQRQHARKILSRI